MSKQTVVQLGSSGGDGAATFGINPSEALDAAGSSNPKKLVWWLYATGSATLVMDAGTVLYKPARGVVFQQHRLAYYSTLAGIFVAGLAQVWTACWLSSSSGQLEGRGRSRAFRATAVCASAVPLAAIVALGGFAVVMRG